MIDEKHDEVSELINIVEKSGWGDDELEKQLVAIRKLGFTNDNRTLEYLNELAKPSVRSRDEWSYEVGYTVQHHPKTKGALYDATVSYARTIICGRPPPNDTPQFRHGYGKYIKCMNVINNSIKELKSSLKES